VSITKLVAKKITNYENQQSIGSKLRSKRIAPLLKIIETIYNEYGRVNIIDVGGTKKYWGIIPQKFLEDNKVEITIINIPGTKVPDDCGLFKFVHADGCNLTEFGNNAFHIAHSNSVIEHVGDWGKMVQFSNELKRVAQKYFVQTPNYWFPVEPHCLTPFIHWLPKPIRTWLVMNFSLGHWKKASSVDESVRIVESARLLNKKMFHALFNDAHILTERLFFMPKSYVAIRK